MEVAALEIVDSRVTGEVEHFLEIDYFWQNLAMSLLLPLV